MMRKDFKVGRDDESEKKYESRIKLNFKNSPENTFLEGVKNMRLTT
jgi:hypothetical protein